MKKTACALLALLICLTGAVSVALAAEMEEEAIALMLEEEELAMMDDGTDTEEEPEDSGEETGSDALGQEDGTAGDTRDEAPAESGAQTFASVEEPDVRWSYGVSLTALQSPCLLLVNAEHPLDKDYEPASMIKITSLKRATSAAVYLDATTAQALEEMFEAASQVTEYTYQTISKKGNPIEKTETYPSGMTLFVKSGYRSYGTQATTYANYLARNNNVDDGYVAKPGASEHQTGLCCDILNADYAGRDRMTQDFKDTPEAQWMKEHCAEFGFILRYPEDQEEATGIRFEPWHFRYVGKQIAGYLTSTGTTLEAFTAEWEREVKEFEEKGGDVAFQLAYEDSMINAPPTSYVLDEYGEDGDAETSLVF